MWIVRLALRRPYTFVVASLLLILAGIVTIRRMPTDIFPEIDIPVVTVIWSYGGISPEEMERRIVTISERAMTTTVSGIEHLESTSLNGVAVIRVFFQPEVKVDAAVAQITAINQTLLRILPPGTTPPLIIRYSASNVPILQAALGSKTLSEQALYDIGLNFIRTRLATVQGAQIPLPWGGKARQIQVDLNPQELTARGLSPADISAAVNAQNVILPGGNAKLGGTEYNVVTNSSPKVLAELGDIPVLQSGEKTVYLRDVANVRDGYAVQNSMVHVNGVRSALLTVLKSAGYSTLDIVERVKTALPQIKATIPDGVDIQLLFDQSLFVRAAIDGVLYEAVIAAALTAMMILLFLGSWRSTVIIAISIPLAVLVSIICLAALGYTLNTMTLGGLGLAVGILVDDATVEIENIHRNLGMKKPLLTAILDGAQQIALPAFVSTLAICIVFVPVLFISGAGKFLFVPLALAVVFAMLASYVLSRTVVPTMARYLLVRETEIYQSGEHGSGAGPIWAVHRWFNRGFDVVRGGYETALAWTLRNRLVTMIAFFVVLTCGGLALPLVGRDFFPSVDAGQFRLHVRCPPGTRLEQSEQYFLAVEDFLRETIPHGGTSMVLDNIGLPVGGVNLAFSDSSTASAADGEILVSLKPEIAGDTHEIVTKLREELPKKFPDLTFFFQSADIVSQILNFGLAAPIDVQVTGPNRAGNLVVARKLLEKIEAIPGAADVHLQQVPDAPSMFVEVDRTRAAEIGLTQRDVASSLLTSLSGSAQAAPNYWLNPQNGVNYTVAVQTPTYKFEHLSDLATTPITAGPGRPPQLLENLATVTRSSTPVSISHYNVQPVYDVLASVSGADLAAVGSKIDEAVQEARKDLPKGTTIVVRGQYRAMQESFLGLGFGLIAAILLVYFLMVVNFQSWTDPFIIIMAVPGALVGVVAMLLMTGTTFSVPSLMGAIMCVGVATANAILLVTFANDQRSEGADALGAAFSAGHTRLRPVLMTAGAMIMGMLPMAIGMGEGGEQNAPLGRAVIGGLSVATVVTLLVVPVLYSLLRQKAPRTSLEPELAVA
ncbi:MAG: efflux RND transporter permease subunit [Phycisphaeraceae bacterium]|nr:efflux RND transporter permease subunit [Phycisphaeraceae bacterium]